MPNSSNPEQPLFVYPPIHRQYEPILARVFEEARLTGSSESIRRWMQVVRQAIVKATQTGAAQETIDLLGELYICFAIAGSTVFSRASQLADPDQVLQLPDYSRI